MTNSVIFDLSKTTPTLLPDVLREAARQALGLAADPLNKLDNNPFISREWMAVSAELHQCAKQLETHLDFLFDNWRPLPEIEKPGWP